MKVYLLRHGMTAYNEDKRYQGTADIPLSPRGEAELCEAEFSPETVYVSPLFRARRTAQSIFPMARQIVVPALTEMDFGVFEGQNHIEMEQDADYRAWVDSNCESRCPRGECRKEFSDRTCAAFVRLMDEAIQCGQSRLVIVAHGGTQMCVMERFALPKRPYFAWCGPTAGGYVLEAEPNTWKRSRQMRLVDTVQYTKDAKGGVR